MRRISIRRGRQSEETDLLFLLERITRANRKNLDSRFRGNDKAEEAVLFLLLMVELFV